MATPARTPKRNHASTEKASERLLGRVMSAVEERVKRMSPEQRRRADAELRRIAARGRRSSGTQR